MVLSVHVRGHLDGVPVLIDKALSLGAYGVALYFLLSGYFSYPSVKKSTDIKTYARKKSARILPMYYVSLLMTFIVGVFITGEYPLDFKWLYHVSFINMFIPSSEWQWWNSVNFFWTMSAFVAWYIISPVLFNWINNSKKALCATIIATVVTPFLKKWMYTLANKQFVDWNFFCLLYVFLLGVLAYFIIEEKKQKIGAVCGVVIAVIGLAVGNRSGFLIFGVFFYLLIILTSFIPFKWKNEKVNSTIKSISAITYSTYLTHWFVISALQSVLPKTPWIVGYLAFLLLAGAIGLISYRFIEKPIDQSLR